MQALTTPTYPLGTFSGLRWNHTRVFVGRVSCEAVGVPHAMSQSQWSSSTSSDHYPFSWLWIANKVLPYVGTTTTWKTRSG